MLKDKLHCHQCLPLVQLTCAAFENITCTNETGAYQELGTTLFPPSPPFGSIISIQFRSDVAEVPVPEPASFVLFGTALIGFGVMRHRRRRPS